MKKYITLALVFVSFTVYSQIIENPGFEEWQTAEEVGGPNPEPTDWSSIQTGTPDNLANFAPQVMFQSTDAHSGNYSIRLKNVFVAIANTVANGIITNGELLLNFDPQLTNTHTDGSDPDHYTYCSSRPDSLVGYYKYSPVDDDVIEIKALLHTGPDDFLPNPDSTGWIGMATFTSPNEATTEWLRFSVPFEYFEDEDPVYIMFNVSSGNGYNAVAGSEAWFDDFDLVFNPVGIDENIAADFSVYAIDKVLKVDLQKLGNVENYTLEIYTVSGQLLISEQVSGGSLNSYSLEHSGIYLCKLQDENGLVLNKKVLVQ